MPKVANKIRPIRNTSRCKDQLSHIEDFLKYGTEHKRRHFEGVWYKSKLDGIWGYIQEKRQRHQLTWRRHK